MQWLLGGSIKLPAIKKQLYCQFIINIIYTTGLHFKKISIFASQNMRIGTRCAVSNKKNYIFLLLKM